MRVWQPGETGLHSASLLSQLTEKQPPGSLRGWSAVMAVRKSVVEMNV